VGVGGFAGALARHAVTTVLPSAFPWGTLVVNVAGAFLLGLFVAGTVEQGRVSASTRLVVATGFLSSFTTYSTFAAETVTFAPPLSVAYVVATYVLGFLAAAGAVGVVRWRS